MSVFCLLFSNLQFTLKHDTYETTLLTLGGTATVYNVIRLLGVHYWFLCASLLDIFIKLVCLCPFCNISENCQECMFMCFGRFIVWLEYTEPSKFH